VQNASFALLVLLDQADSFLSFVCATNMDVGQGFRLGSYRSSWEPSTGCTIWQAARATSAAPLYFPPVRFGTPPANYVDGGFTYNNPVRALYDEAKHLWHASSGRKVGCIISIGMCVPPVKPTGDRGTTKLGNEILKPRNNSIRSN
jgi:predicted acylesterase/phospholipase RssA